jgi:hypothetical protein
MEKKDLKKKFPNLYNEIQSDENSIEIQGIRWDEKERNDLAEPDIYSFLRRCKTDDEGFQIIEFLEKREEISKDLANDLRQQIKSRGIRSFGEKKFWGYYEEKYRKSSK